MNNWVRKDLIGTVCICCLLWSTIIIGMAYFTILSQNLVNNE